MDVRVDSLENVRAALAREVEAAQNTILEGKAATFDSYKYQVGYLRGLRKAYEMMLPQPVPKKEKPSEGN